MKSSQDKKKRFSMNKYLSVLITLLIFGGFGASAEETKLIPLTEYIKISDPNDEFTWEFMSKRCAGISFTLATRWYPEDSENHQKSKENYNVYANAAILMRKKKYPNEDNQKIKTSITNDILRLLDPLDSVMRDNQDKTGSIILNSWLMGDKVICEELFKP